MPYHLPPSLSPSLSSLSLCVCQRLPLLGSLSLVSFFCPSGSHPSVTACLSLAVSLPHIHSILPSALQPSPHSQVFHGEGHIPRVPNPRPLRFWKGGIWELRGQAPQKLSSEAISSSSRGHSPKSSSCDHPFIWSI